MPTLPDQCEVAPVTPLTGDQAPLPSVSIQDQTYPTCGVSVIIRSWVLVIPDTSTQIVLPVKSKVPALKK